MLLDEATEDMVCAAYLHDTAEDCNVPISMLRADFNHPIAELVEELTNVSKITHPKADRAERKQLDLDRIKGVSREAKLIKLCDRIDNLRDIPLTEDFAPKYAAESKELLEVLRGTHQGLEAEYEEVLSWF
jgi:guanosine-3',5'-bis(diphosphate) 3'-pyrophosphohydrolase